MFCVRKLVISFKKQGVIQFFLTVTPRLWYCKLVDLGAMLKVAYGVY